MPNRYNREKGKKRLDIGRGEGGGGGMERESGRPERRRESVRRRMHLTSG